MSKESALEKCTKAIEKRNRFIEDNKAVFNGYEKIGGEIIDAENELRDAVAEANTGVSNAEFTVTVTPQTQRVYNEDKLKQFLSGPQFADAVNDVTRPPKISIKKN
jgi:hypothetical protein